MRIPFELLSWVPLLSLSLGLVACTDPEPARRAAAPAPSPASAEEPAPEPEPDPEPPALPEARTLHIAAADRVTLVGDLRAPPDPSAPLVILVHQLSSSRAEWEPLLRHLAAEPPMATFALDMRGHGESTEGPRGAEVSWQSFETEDWQKVAGDVRAVLDHLLSEASLNPSRVLLVGSSIGSSAVILAAAADERVNAVVALSPGRAYRGVDAISPLPQLGERPLLAVASRNEAPAAETATDMGRVASAGTTLLVEGDVHGVAMFERDPTSLEAVVTFLRAQSVPPPPR